jgi:hypothetical protein
VKKNYLIRLLAIFIIIVITCSISLGQSITPPTLSTPADSSTNYKFTRVTYDWEEVTDAVSYDLQICKNNAFNTSDLKTYQNITTNSYTAANYILDLNQQYYWRVRAKVGTGYSAYSSAYTFAVGTPNSSIGSDANASISFDHATGQITQITYKGGSNEQLLNTSFNEKNKVGFGRINNETGTKLISWTESTGNYVYNYENPSYGAKTLTVKWDADGITVDIAITPSASKSIAMNAGWIPGGNIGPLYDHVIYETSDTVFSKKNLTYPGTSSALFSGNTVLCAMYDDTYDELFGFTCSSGIQTTLQQAVAFGPAFAIPASASPSTVNLSFAIKKKAKFFTWANKKYIVVNSPIENTNILDQSSPTVTWETFGISGNLTIKLSTDNGATFPNTLISGTADDSTQSVTLPNLSASVPLKKCIIQVSGTGASGNSSLFSIVSNTSSVFSISRTLTGAPSDKVSVPIKITPATGAKINSLDLRLEYDKNILTFVSSSNDTIVNNWTFAATNNSTGSFVQIGGFKQGGGKTISSASTLITLTFSVKPSTRVGTQTSLLINNTYLSAADSNAQYLKAVGIDGLLTLYSRISGNLRYIINKKPITGAKLTNFIYTASSDTITGITNSLGFFDFSNMIPGSNVKIEPISAKNLPDSLTKAVNAIDALIIFNGREGGSNVISDLQKVAADINADGKINSTDAYAALKISTGELKAANFGVNNWIFIDSSFTLNSSNWASVPQNKSYQPLDTIKSKQSFWGMIRGDVDGSYNSQKDSTKITINKSMLADMFTGSNSIQYSVPGTMTVCPGDTLSIPLYVKLNGNTIGAFNSSIQIDKDLFTYTGKFVEGSSLPSNKGWCFSTYFDSNGKLNIGATDFSDVLDPITKDGIVATFKFVVNSNSKIGDSCPILLSGLTTADAKLLSVPASIKNGNVIISTVTDVISNDLKYEYSLSQNYPNPFNPSTTLEYTLKDDIKVEIEIFNALGQKVAMLYNGLQSKGKHSIHWNAQNNASGIYFYRLRAGDFTRTMKMLLVK